MEIYLEGWEAVQRQGQVITERFGCLAQGLGCMLQSQVKASTALFSLTPIIDFTSQQFRVDQEFQWPWPLSSFPLSRCYSSVEQVFFRSREKKRCSDHNRSSVAWDTSSGVLEVGNRLGQFGVEFGTRLGELAGHVSKHLSHIHATDESDCRTPAASFEQPASTDWHTSLDFLNGGDKDDAWISNAMWQEHDDGKQTADDEGFFNQDLHSTLSDVSNEKLSALFSMSQGHFHKQNNVTMTTTFDSRTQDIESSVVASGELWRVEASYGSTSTMNGSSPLLLFQIGPILFVRDSTLLLPVHLSKQHLLWYGFDRKNGIHSVCPAIWTKNRKWLFMSMFCLNHLTCSFMDLQFPNGQLTYIAGEGLAGGAFLPLFGGLLQAQGRHPGEARLSFSCKNKWGTKWVPSIELPEKSVSFGVIQTLAWQRCGMMLRPTLQLNVTPTQGGRSPGWKVELIHSPEEKLSWACGCALTNEPCGFATVSVGRSKRNGEHIGTSGLVLHLETPLDDFRRASFSIRLNSGIEF